MEGLNNYRADCKAVKCAKCGQIVNYKADDELFLAQPMPCQCKSKRKVISK